MFSLHESFILGSVIFFFLLAYLSFLNTVNRNIASTMFIHYLVAWHGGTYLSFSVKKWVQRQPKLHSQLCLQILRAEDVAHGRACTKLWIWSPAVKKKNKTEANSYITISEKKSVFNILGKFLWFIRIANKIMPSWIKSHFCVHI